MFRVNDYFAATPGYTRPPVFTKRGRVFSIQASAGHYCSPRDNTGPYSCVEVMVINGSDPAAFIRSNGKRSTNDRIYSWLPVSVVEDVINRIDGGVA